MDRDGAFTAFVEARSAGLLRFAVALTGDRHQAEDLLQGVLERVYGKWSKVAGRGDPEWYVKRALVNAARDGWRRRQRRPETFDLDEEEGVYTSSDEGDGVYTPFDEVLTREVVRGALAGLPPRQRIVLVLRYWACLTEPETAELMGTSVGTVKSQAHRALRTMRQRLSLEDEVFAAQWQGGRR